LCFFCGALGEQAHPDSRLGPFQAWAISLRRPVGPDDGHPKGLDSAPRRRPAFADTRCSERLAATVSIRGRSGKGWLIRPVLPSRVAAAMMMSAMNLIVAGFLEKRSRRRG
jgi:hypothetical protein